MKKYLYTGLLTACLSAPAFAAPSKFAAQSPEQPLHRRTIVLSALILLGLQALRHAPRLPARPQSVSTRQMTGHGHAPAHLAASV